MCSVWGRGRVDGGGDRRRETPKAPRGGMSPGMPQAHPWRHPCDTSIYPSDQALEYPAASTIKRCIVPPTRSTLICCVSQMLFCIGPPPSSTTGGRPNCADVRFGVKRTLDTDQPGFATHKPAPQLEAPLAPIQAASACRSTNFPNFLKAGERPCNQPPPQHAPPQTTQASHRATEGVPGIMRMRLTPELCHAIQALQCPMKILKTK